MTKTEMKLKAQDMIMNQMANIGYGSDYEDFVSECNEAGIEDADLFMKKQMDRVAKLFGFPEAWFY